ncbi:hypothetical protein LXL04_034241 [Taraxacum kok-saghyz]
MGSNQASTDSHLPASYPLCFAFSTTFFTPSLDLSTESMGSLNLEISFTHDFLCQRDPNQDRSAYFFLFFFIIAYGVKIICLGWMFPCITCPDLPASIWSCNIKEIQILSTGASILPDLKIMAKKKPIEGVSDQMNAIASQNLDHAPARRRVRLAFTQVQEQLDHVLFKMAPTGIRTEEWFEMNSMGEEIFCKSWLLRPGVRIKAAVCFVHGYGDTCTFFFEGIAKRIAAAGYGVYAIDHPGFGLSEGLHGYIPNFSDLVGNVIEQYTKIKGRPEVRGMPRFLLGQSMGGAVALKVHLKEQREWDGVISEEMKPPEPLQKVLIFLSRLMPKAKLVPQKDLAELMFRDPQKRKLAEKAASKDKQL